MIQTFIRLLLTHRWRWFAIAYHYHRALPYAIAGAPLVLVVFLPGIDTTDVTGLIGKAKSLGKRRTVINPDGGSITMIIYTTR